ncbi:hypothetical protein [Sulfitobacter sp. SK011]|uniref:hypothetical protein n=1 Tax=Sulfitobacter sp. SK011 TaxID=1389004 RepID=UPI000E0ACDDF|nr:hypothetical protein [Sulfitobacter sp. SK011]AXI43056.1 hypothetical protein C1J02_14780 [Sulfitobacter sp. SK011]
MGVSGLDAYHIAHVALRFKRRGGEMGCLTAESLWLDAGVAALFQAREGGDITGFSGQSWRSNATLGWGKE